jgi:hypothetical protein
MLHDRREEEEEEACAAPAGPDVAANAARTSTAEVPAHHSAFLRFGSLIWTNLRTG